MDLVIAAGVGVVVGLVMGGLGGGGGIIAVPALVYLIGQDPQVAGATSLLVVGVTAVVGGWQHHRRGNVAVADGLAFAVAASVGAVGGAWASRGVEGPAFMLAFGLLLLVVAALMWRRSSRARRVGEELVAPVGPRPSRSRLQPARLIPAASVAVGVGLLTGFFGVGGGFAAVPALALVLGLPMRRAVGTSLLVLSITSTVALLTRVSGGVALDWPVVVVFAVAAVLSSLVGARLNDRARPEQLARAFAILLLAVAAYTLVNAGLALA